tara:strand:- start:907 stop:1596 length:690 start_codon:yes stop_codon:yes gene_type:complete
MKNTKVEALRGLVEFGIPVSQIIDVGVQRATFELIKCFPDLEHILFEPADNFNADIRANYKNIEHKLFNVAISSKAGKLFQTVTSIKKNGIATHSRVTQDERLVDGNFIISSKPIDVLTLDSYVDFIKPECLLKVDVDGADLEVIKGADLVLKKSSIVVIEATKEDFIERANYVISRGFELANIVDRTLYGPSMWQFDYIFVRSELLREKDFPVPSKNFDLNLWRNVDR